MEGIPDRSDRLDRTGLQRLLGMAAAEPRFAAALLTRRAEAVSASGVALTPTEASALAAVSDAALGRMIAGLGPTLGEPTRRAFLARAGQALAVLALAGAAAGPAAAAPRPTAPDESALRAFLASDRVSGRVEALQSGTGARPDPPLTWAGRVTYPEPRVTGPAAVAEARQAAHRTTWEPIQRCYERRLRASGRLAGRIEVSYRVRRDGGAQDVRVTADPVGDRELTACVTGAFARIRLRTQRGESAVTQPVVFTPGSKGRQ